MTATIHRLPGVDSTPVMLLAQLQGMTDQIESLVVIVRWKEGGHQFCCTAQDHAQLTFANMVCDEAVRQEVTT